ncbi:hypothetical protein BDD43_5317 [Mucilaginibacter gracilis]|uniref:Uncharacterized protein n=1 Tax=Mucilaginibacter gracilis TaxID=423350 RepID=A0A495J8Q3_9SPHI|nr:hypothetical protein [Mucilaginibacter gracilis]RKR85061.1 hypothetical protein BDD43_5317 [Mucilaginibacter gracilis]
MKTTKPQDWNKEVKKEAKKIIDENLKELNKPTDTSKNNDSPSLRNQLPGRKVPKR